MRCTHCNRDWGDDYYVCCPGCGNRESESPSTRRKLRAQSQEISRLKKELKEETLRKQEETGREPERPEPQKKHGRWEKWGRETPRPFDDSEY